MKYYETLFIVHPALEAGRLKDNIVLMQETLEKHGGKIITIDFWGKKKLAYFIEKQRYGTYVLFQFNAEGKCLKEFSLEMEHNPNVLAYMTTKINIIRKKQP